MTDRAILVPGDLDAREALPSPGWRCSLAAAGTPARIAPPGRHIPAAIQRIMDAVLELARELHPPFDAVSGEICRQKGTFFSVSGEI
jgi:hypothetical protein